MHGCFLPHFLSKVFQSRFTMNWADLDTATGTPDLSGKTS
jgi:hypothetical protein